MMLAMAALQAVMPAAQAAASPLQVDIEAPADIRALLGRHLDLVRATQLRDDESLEASELQRLTAAAPAQVRELLKTEGWFEPDIVVVHMPGPPPVVQLRVRPGPRIRVASIDVRTEGALQPLAAGGDAQARAFDERLRRAGSLQAGQPFRNPAWSETKLQWLAALRAAGYAAATLRSSQAEIDVAAGTARLVGVLDSGPLFLAGALHVEGLQRHDLATVRHLAGFGPGRPLTESLLLDYQDRLQKTGLFDSVSITFDAHIEQAGASTVTVHLNELPLQQATVGVGLSTDTGPRASLEHQHRRPFGWAMVAHDKLEWGRDVQRWNADVFSHPGAGFVRWLLGVQVERERSATDLVLSQRVRVGRTQDTPAFERLAFVEWLRSRQSLASGEVADAQAASANLHLVLRRLDNVLLPTRGVSLSLQWGLGQARSTQGGVGPYARLQGRLTGYLPLGAQWYAKARVEVGQIVKRDALVVPDALGFRAGGDESVRGYAYRSLAPVVSGHVVSGNTLLTASAELARPISADWPALWGALFVDAGRATDRWQDFKPALGYGAGLRWRSPIGPVRVDLAWADELRKARLHLGVGVSF